MMMAAAPNSIKDELVATQSFLRCSSLRSSGRFTSPEEFRSLGEAYDLEVVGGFGRSWHYGYGGRVALRT